MARYYYGTVPVLAWIINHYFFARTHHAWLADAFLPHDAGPGAPNPHAAYARLYEPWARRDGDARVVSGYRAALLKGVVRQQRARQLDGATAARLRRLCETAGAELFYPVLYRVNLDAIAPARRVPPRPGARDGREVLVADLRESEFDLLFTDNVRDDYFAPVVLGELEGSVRMHPMAVLALLEARAGDGSG